MLLIVAMEGVYNFIGKPHEAIDRINRKSQRFSERPDAQGEGGAVCFGGLHTAFVANLVIQCDRVHGVITSKTGNRFIVGLEAKTSLLCPQLLH
jgi:hypothetical protein